MTFAGIAFDTGFMPYLVCRMGLASTRPVRRTSQLPMLTVKLFVYRIHGNEQWT